jgi:hypothetical protein
MAPARKVWSRAEPEGAMMTSEFWRADVNEMITIFGQNVARRLKLAQSFSLNLVQDGRQVCRPAANFSVTKMQE